MNQSDARPGAVEGSCSSTSVAVVGAQCAGSGDHTAPGGASGETLDVGALMDCLDGHLVNLPVRLEVLGDVIDIAWLTIHDGEIRIVGAEVIDP